MGKESHIERISTLQFVGKYVFPFYQFIKPNQKGSQSLPVESRRCRNDFTSAGGSNLHARDGSDRLVGESVVGSGVPSE